ncbi:MAG TPA: xylulokinase [Clostridiaceae bacterium]|nr:xylulokinase [Clostridiaceae bacterium]
MSFVLGIDLGTSSVISLILNICSGESWTEQIEYQYEIPCVGWAQQNADDWWKATVKSIQIVLDNSGIDKEEIIALSFSGQMHGIVPLDKNNCPVHPAIIWCDQRSTDIVERYSTREYVDFFGEHTANKLHTGFGLASLLWIKENDPATYQQISKICCPKDYLRYKLTGIVATEQTDAASILAYDVKNAKWSKKIIEKFEIDLSLFPEVKLPTDNAGKILPNIAEEIGLSKNCTVYFGGADQAMVAIGNGMINPGDTSITIGTGGQVVSILDSPSYYKSLSSHTFNFVEKNSWYFLGATLSAGQSLKWLRQNILESRDYKSMDLLAEQKPCGSEGLIFLPYLIGDRTPHSDGKANGMFVGLKMKTDRGTLIRSVLEGVAYSLKDSLSILEEFGVLPEFVVASGGGANSPLWLQIQADIFNVPIIKSKAKEQSALGAAITAAVGYGLFNSFQEAIDIFIEYDKEPILPIEYNVERYKEFYSIYKELYSANKEFMHRLSDLASEK